MLNVEQGKEKSIFISYIEKAIKLLSREEYASFISFFDYSHLSEEDLKLALRFYDETYPILKIDDPTVIKCNNRGTYLIRFLDGSGYHMDYDLTTDGEINDLTMQVVFRKCDSGYEFILDDLHCL